VRVAREASLPVDNYGDVHESGRDDCLPSIRSLYEERLRSAKRDLASAQTIRSRALVAVVSFLFLLVLLCAGYFHYEISSVFPLLTITAFGYAFLVYRKSGADWKRLDRLCGYFERGINRATDRWQNSGRSGRDFARSNHPYQEDLNILGNGSLFERLCSTRTTAGARRLADYLLSPVSLDESRLRQEAVIELRDRHQLREEICLTGLHEFQDFSEDELQTWFDLAPLETPMIVPYLLLSSSLGSLLIGIGILVRVTIWTYWAPPLICLVILQLSIAGYLFRRIHPRLRLLRSITGSLTVFRQGLEIMSRERFKSAKLSGLGRTIQYQDACSKIKKLENLFQLLDQREKPHFYAASLALAFGTQLVLRMEGWRALYQEHLRSWIDAWGEFEALQSLASYAYEQASNTFPEFLEGPAKLQATLLRHPLLREENSVGNDVSLDVESRIYIVSGTNMSGKSTLLRAIGLNSVLAFAGAPLCAESVRISHLTICASIAVSDSLPDGKSKFFAEVEQIRGIIDRARSDSNVLFLIDEILSGTNSQDRKVATKMIVRELLINGAIGALSTHDLALTEIAEDQALATVLVYMSSTDSEHPLEFDYRLKRGIAQDRNALAIVKMMGIGATIAG